MMMHTARAKIRKNKNGYQVTFPKHLGDLLELSGDEEMEFSVTEYDDGGIECTAILLF